jgi:putative spermidine/putrescine transport system ATP-binding protein
MNQGKSENKKTSIKLKTISKRFLDGTVAVNEVNLEISGGEILVLVGPSGCGKTTTLRIIGGLEKPDPGGEVYYDDLNVSNVPIEKRNVGIVFQNYALFPNMNVFENVEYGLRMRKMQKEVRRARVLEVLNLVNIVELAEKYPDSISGGQKQRVALARALAVYPVILLLDEPLTALDAKLREKLRIELHRLLKSLGITTVYVTHDQTEAMSLGDRVAVMNQGKLIQIGTPYEIYQNPVDDFVATFIGTTNLFKGKIIEENKVKYVDIDFFRMQLKTNELLNQTGDITVMFRPEDVKIVPQGKEQFSGTIKNSFYLGDKTRVFIEVGTGAEIIADISERMKYKSGEEIFLALKENALYTFKKRDS